MERLPVIKGTLDVLVLKALMQAPLHGFEITCWLEDTSGSALEVEESAVYQALYRLEAKGLVSADWGVTENNRRARYYGLTAEGRLHLQSEAERLIRYAATMTGILQVDGGAP